jgi:16S rRNA processing protein RimM
MTEKVVLVGKILKTHGVKGLVKLQSYTQNPKDIFNYSVLFNKDLSKQYRIKFKNNLNKNTFIVELNDINNVNDAEKFKDVELYIKRTSLPKLKNNEFYSIDLIGLKVLTDKYKSGIILQVNNFGAGSMIEVEWNDGASETIPLTEHFIKEINLEKKYVKINLPEYIE